MNKSKGITLIALVITIIVLLILAGISIATLTGDNGVLTKANKAGEETKKAEYKEVLELIGNGLRPEKVLENLSSEDFISRYKEKIDEEIGKGETLNGATASKRGKKSIIVVTKEKYVFLVTENSVVCLGEQTGENPPDLNEDNVEFIVSPEDEWTKEDVSVEIKTDLKGHLLEYSIDNKETWEIYDNAVIMQENGTIYARLTDINGLGQAGGEVEKTITKIDKKAPTGELKTTLVKSTKIAISVTAQDAEGAEKNGCSGIKGYYYSCDGGENYTEEMTTNTTYTFENLNPETEYNIAVKVVDWAGNDAVVKLPTKTTAAIYLVKEGKLIQNPTGYAGLNDGSYYSQGNRLCRILSKE